MSSDRWPVSAPVPEPAPATDGASRWRVERWQFWMLAGVALLIALSLALYLVVLAPRMGRGTTTPQQYGRAALDYVQATGVDAGSVAFADARRQAEQQLSTASTHAQARAAVASVLSAAGGGKLVAPEDVPSGRPSAAQQQSRASRAGRITTVVLPTLGGGDSLDLRRYGQNVSDAVKIEGPQTCGWVLDLRASEGVDLPHLLQPLAPFLHEGSVLSIQRRGGRDAIRVTGGEIEQGGAVRAGGASLPKVTGPVAVLIDRGTQQDAALAARALTSSPHVRLFGEPTDADPRIWNETRLNDGWLLRVATGRYAGVADKGGATGEHLVATGTVAEATNWLAAQCPTQ